ncbi:MAG: hypothetical protein HPM95_05810 [Alphaproteobacteria bacterium]|nr:hypothetical protein [Alphaproteobacteria bacterium]
MERLLIAAQGLKLVTRLGDGTWWLDDLGAVVAGTRDRGDDPASCDGLPRHERSARAPDLDGETETSDSGPMPARNVRTEWTPGRQAPTPISCTTART